MAIAYKSQGAGISTETSGASLSPLCPATVDANDILLAHVVYLDNATTPSTPAGWTLLFGPSGLGTGTPTGRAWAFGKIAVGDEDADAISFGTAGGTAGRLARIYSFSGYISGTITTVIPSASFTENSSETDPVIQAVTTTVAGAKAVALVSQDDNNSHAGLGAVSGGTWVEAVADYVDTGVGPQGAKLQIQVGTPTTDPGTISGGTVAGTDDEANTLNFEIRESAPPILLAGVTGLTAALAGILTTAIECAGSILGQATVVAALTTEITLVGASTGQSAESGALTTEIQLAGILTGVGAPVGVLTTEIQLAGPAAGTMTGAGDLIVEGDGALLEGLVVVVVTLSGVLYVEPEPPGDPPQTDVGRSQLSSTHRALTRSSWNRPRR